MAKRLYISYCRVSTLRQGASGLGLAAQQAAITSYVQDGAWERVAEFIEVESGKKNERPKLQEALALCRRTGATLVIAKLDRLARNVAFISRLMETSVDFVAVDFPEANRLTVHILSAVAEYEGRMISDRTKAGLTMAKAKGVKLGRPENATPEGRAKGTARAVASKVAKADKFAKEMMPVITAYEREGLNLLQIARKLNSSHLQTARGKRGSWTAQAVKNIKLRSPHS